MCELCEKKNMHTRLRFVDWCPSCRTMGSPNCLPMSPSLPDVCAAVRHETSLWLDSSSCHLFFFLKKKKEKHLIHPCWPPWFPKEGPAASSLFIIISLWLPPSALDPGRSWHRQPWPIKPYILFNLLSSARPRFKGRPGPWDGHTTEKWAR